VKNCYNHWASEEDELNGLVDRLDVEVCLGVAHFLGVTKVLGVTEVLDEWNVRGLQLVQHVLVVGNLVILWRIVPSLATLGEQGVHLDKPSGYNQRNVQASQWSEAVQLE
jgi:hypothetical protein